MENYLQVLEESLHKKAEVLLRIEQMNKEQERILQEKEVDMDAFDKTLERKDELIGELGRLDEGFETLYDRIREQLLIDKQKHRSQIAKLQHMIAEVTDKGVSIQAQEARNKRLAESYFSKMKKEVKRSRMNSKAALDYYRNMNKSGIVNPQFVDKKN